MSFEEDPAAKALIKDLNKQEAPKIAILKFWDENRLDPNTGEEKVREFVEWTKIGDKFHSTTVQRIDLISGQSGRMPAIEWSQIKDPYDAWKKGEELRAVGTAFVDWRGFDPELAGILERMGVYTVEQFADIPNHQASAIKYPNAKKWHGLAQEFVKDNADRSILREELADRDAQLAEMRQQNADTASALAALKQQLAAMQAQQAGAVPDVPAHSGVPLASPQPIGDAPSPQPFMAPAEPMNQVPPEAMQNHIERQLLEQQQTTAVPPNIAAPQPATSQPPARDLDAEGIGPHDPIPVAPPEPAEPDHAVEHELMPPV